MASAFVRSGFEAVDVHMSDLIAGRADLASFAGMVAVGGFSYGDVLGAGRGWATPILERTALRDMFETFFARGDSFSLGVCHRSAGSRGGEGCVRTGRSWWSENS